MNIPSLSLPDSLRRFVLIALLCLPGMVAAHGLLLDAENQGDTIQGTVYYSNGELAVHESVELRDLSTPDAAPVAGMTDANGKFSFPVTPNHRYRISAYGEEGHGVDVELQAVVDAKPQLVDDEAAADSDWLPPAWMVIGGLLLASLIPVLVSRRRAAH